MGGQTYTRGNNQELGKMKAEMAEWERHMIWPALPILKKKGLIPDLRFFDCAKCGKGMVTNEERVEYCGPKCRQATQVAKYRARKRAG